MMKVCVEECVVKGIEVLGDKAFCGFSIGLLNNARVNKPTL